MSTGNISRLDPEEVAKAVTDFINTTIMARSRPVRPDDDLELAGPRAHRGASQPFPGGLPVAGGAPAPPFPGGPVSRGRGAPRPARRAAGASPASSRAGGVSRGAGGRAKHGDRSPPRAAAAPLD